MLFSSVGVEESKIKLINEVYKKQNISLAATLGNNKL